MYLDVSLHNHKQSDEDVMAKQVWDEGATRPGVSKGKPEEPVSPVWPIQAIQAATVNTGSEDSIVK